MKKLVTIMLTLVLILCVTACESTKLSDSADNESKGTPDSTDTVSIEKPTSSVIAELPLKGFHGIDREIIIETDDQISFYHQEYFSVKNAYHYSDGQLLKLDEYETRVIIKSDVSNNGYISIPIKYYICQDTVYPYFNVNPHSAGLNIYEFAPIKGDSENILIYCGGTEGIEPIVYNVKNGEYHLLFTETESSRLAFPAGIDADGQYVAIYGGSKSDIRYGNGENYVLNLKTGKSQKIKVPKFYNYTRCSVSPLRFVGNELLISLEFRFSSNLDENIKETYYFNPENGSFRKLDNEMEFDIDLNYNPNDYLAIKRDREKGSIQLFNIKTNKCYSYTLEADIGVLPSKSGRFLLSGYSNAPIEGVDDNGNIIYSDSEQSNQPFFVDLEKCKKIDITKYVKDFTIDTYMGCPVRSRQWVDETCLLITYEKDNVLFTDILDLRTAME